MDREQEIARQHLRTGNKDRAVVALRRRKYQESLLHRTDAQLESLEQLVSTIEFSLVQVSVLHGLKQGNEVLKEIHREMNPESVERLLEETAEAQAYQRVRHTPRYLNWLSQTCSFHSRKSMRCFLIPLPWTKRMRSRWNSDNYKRKRYVLIPFNQELALSMIC